jgi:hypothetical protein
VLTKEIGRNKNRVKSFLYYHGINIPLEFSNKTYWSKRFTVWLQDVILPTQSARITLSSIIEIVTFLREKQYQTLQSIKELSQENRYKESLVF